MPIRSIAAVTALALAILAACGKAEDTAPPGAPAPPEAGATTDCPQPQRGLSPLSPDRGRVPYGFNDHAGLVGAIPLATDAELHERAGSSLWRVAIDWRFAEPEPGEISLETHDAIYCEGLERGIRPIFHITGAPAWAAEPGECPVSACIDPPRRDALDELRDFALLVAGRYPRAAAIEAWNEPNLATFWSEPDPRRYVGVLRAIDDGVKAAGTGTPVLGGSLSNTGRTDATRVDFARFLEGMYRAGAARYMDGLAFHPYPIAPLDSAGERFTPTMAELERIAREPIWVTEVGLPVGGGISEADQAATMDGVYRYLSRDPRVRAVVFHTLVEASEEAGEGDGFGWVVQGAGGELTPRPAFREFG